MAVTKLFDTVVLYNNPDAAVDASAAQMLLIDLATIGSSCTVTFPASATAGQVVGIQVYDFSGGAEVLLAGPVQSPPLTLSQLGDCALWTWSTERSEWEFVDYSRAQIPPLFYGSAFATGSALTTLDTTFGDLLSLAPEMPLDGVLLIDVSVDVEVNGSNTDPSVLFRLLVDGAPIGVDNEVTWQSMTNTTRVSFALTKRVAGVLAGPHTVALQWRLGAQTNGDTATANEANLRVLLAAEL